MKQDKPDSIEPQAADEKPQRLIYCGPSIPGGRLNQFAVFKGGCPEYLDDLFSACPAVKELFVPVADLPKVRLDLGRPGSEASNLYNEVWQYLKKEGKGNV